MSEDDLAEQLRLLAERVTRLEGAPRQTRDVANELLGRVNAASSKGTVLFAGAGLVGEATLMWQRECEWDDVRARVNDATARVLAALGNTVRQRIVSVLLGGPATTGELTERLDQPTSGQLFHHLKELIAAGLIHQPVRGTYAIRHQDVIAVLAVFAASLDLAVSGGWTEPE